MKTLIAILIAAVALASPVATYAKGRKAKGHKPPTLLLSRGHGGGHHGGHGKKGIV